MMQLIHKFGLLVLGCILLAQACTVSAEVLQDEPFSLKELLVRSKANEKWLIDLRRELHQMPEASGFEYNTSLKIRSTLEANRITHRFFTTLPGVLAFVGSGKPEVLLRADIDGLPITEPLGLSFRSKTEGMMHACGHDAHTAMLLGAAKLLKELGVEKEDEDGENFRVEYPFKGTIHFVFQPDEEGGAGAKKILQERQLQNVDVAFGLHSAPFLDSGLLGTRVGTIMAGALSFSITVTGRGGHAALPHLNADPVVASAAIITALQSLVSRETSPLGSAVVSVTKLQGGEAYNVIPSVVTLGGTIRALDHTTMEHLQERVVELTSSIAKAHGCNASVSWRETEQPYYPPTVNDATTVAATIAIASELFGAGAVVTAEPLMAAEDFSFYCQKVPCSFSFLGMKNESAGLTAGLHSPFFKVDESVLHRGAALHAAFALQYLRDHEVPEDPNNPSGYKRPIILPALPSDTDEYEDVEATAHDEL